MNLGARPLLPALLVLGAGAALIVLGTHYRDGPAVPPPKDEPAASVPLPTAADAAALTGRLAERHPELGARTREPLLWYFDRLAEALAEDAGGPAPEASPPTDVQGSAIVRALAELGPDALPALVAALTHRSGREGPKVADEAAAALGALPPATAERLADFYGRAEDPRLRRGLVLAAGQLRPAIAPVLELLMTAAGDGQPWVKVEAFNGLGALGEEAAAALPAVRRQLESELEVTRLPAAVAVLRIAGPDEAAHEVIATHLASGDPFDRAEAVQLLVELGDPGREAWPDLIPLLGDERRTPLLQPERRVAPDRVSWAAADALVTLNARGLAEKLRVVVAGDDPRARIGAGLALLGLGIQFAEAPRVLVEALQFEEDSNWLEWKRLEVIRGVLDPEYADDVLLDALVERLHGLHGKASALALLSLGEAGRGRVRAILSTTGEKRAYERHSVLLAFLDDPQRGKDFEAELRKLAKNDSNSWNRDTAGDLLNR